MKETNIAKLILLAASQHGHRLFLNMRGKGLVGGKQKHNRDGSITLFGATQVAFGVGPNGASDLLGLTCDGKFAAVEVKTESGPIREGQPEFIAMVRSFGGVAGIARSVDDALAILSGEIRD